MLQMLLCWEAILVSDGYSCCIHCLEESRVAQEHLFCLVLKSRARKNREIKLLLLMIECSMLSFGPRPGDPICMLIFEQIYCLHDIGAPLLQDI